MKVSVRARVGPEARSAEPVPQRGRRATRPVEPAEVTTEQAPAEPVGEAFSLERTPIDAPPPAPSLRLLPGGLSVEAPSVEAPSAEVTPTRVELEPSPAAAPAAAPVDASLALPQPVVAPAEVPAAMAPSPAPSLEPVAVVPAPSPISAPSVEPAAVVPAATPAPSLEPTPDVPVAILASLVEAAAAEPAGPLPDRTAQEMTLGRSLEHVAVRSGPATRAALDTLDADGAALGSDVFVRELPAVGSEENELPARAVLTHEVAHAADTSPAVAAVTTAAVEGPAERVGQSLARAVEGFHRPAADEPPPRPLAREDVARASPGEGRVGLRRSATERPPTPVPAMVEGDPAAAFAEQRSAAPVGERPRRAGDEARAEATTPPPPAPAVAPEGGAGATEAAQPELGDGELRVLTASPGADIPAPEPPPLEGEGVDGLTSAFVHAPPSQKAFAQGSLGEGLEREAQADATTFVDELPAIEQTMGGEEGMGEVPELQLEGTAADAIAPAAAPEPVAEDLVPAAPENEEFTGNDGLMSWFRDLFGGSPAANASDIATAIDNVETVDESVETSPGPPPPVPLEGATDPALIADQRTQGLGEADDGQAQSRTAVVEGPGPEVVQPLEMDERVELDGIEQAALEPQPPVEGIEAFKAAGMPAEVQATFDEQNGAAMEASLAGAEQQVSEATATRDADWEAETERARTENEALVDTAHEEQSAAVEQQRERIQDERQTTLDRQDEEVARVRGDADELDAQQRQEIDDRVAEDEAAIEDRYADAETDAETEVAEGERRAEEERREAEREAENDSWWDRATSWIGDAISALVDAVTAIIDTVRSAVNGLLDAVRDAVVGLIEAAAAFIQEAIAVFGELLKVLVDELLGEIFPELAAALTELIDEAVEAAQQAVRAVADTLIAGVNALVDSIKAGLNAVLDAFQAAVNFAGALIQAALAGDWGEVLRLLLEAALALAGISPADFYAFIGQVTDTIGLIVDDPLGFLGNLFRAVELGFDEFVENIVDHLRSGFFEWIVGPLGELGITLPQTWDVWSILGIVLQVLGLTQQGIRGVIVEELGETAGAIFDFVWRYVDALITGGWQGLWEQIQQDLSGLWDMVVDGIKSWLIETIITQGTLKLLSLIDPTGISAIVQVVTTAWQLYTFLRDNLRRIWGVVRAVVDTLSAIAHGNLEPAAVMVENALASLIPIAISLLANLLGLGGITARVREIIEGIRETVRNAIRSLIRRVRGLFRGGAGAEAEQQTTGEGLVPGDGELGQRRQFESAGAPHALWIEAAGPRIVVASNVEEVRSLLDSSRVGTLSSADPELAGHVTRAKSILADASSSLEAELAKLRSGDRTGAEAEDADLERQMGELAESLSHIMFKVEASRKPSTITLLFEESNRVSTNTDDDYGESLLQRLRSFGGGILSVERSGSGGANAISQIRGRDKVWTVSQGAIYAPFVLEHAQAARELARELEGIDYLLSLERGGAFLAAQLLQGSAEPPAESIDKLVITQEYVDRQIERGTLPAADIRTLQRNIGNELRTAYKLQQQTDLIARIEELAAAAPADRIITFAITETMVGGGSVSQLIRPLQGLVRRFPNIRFKILVLEQTMHREIDEMSGLQLLPAIRDADKLQLVIQSIRYIVGEDVDYQTARSAPQGSRPVILFKGSGNNVKAYRIDPITPTTARDIIIDLVDGAYNGSMPGVL